MASTVAVAVFMCFLQATPSLSSPSHQRSQSVKTSKSVVKNRQQEQAAPSSPTTNQYVVEAPLERAGKDWWDRANVIGTGLLVLVGLAGSWLALRSLNAMREQTGIAITAANAAKSGAETAAATLAQAQATAEAQLRAYVCFNAARLTFPQPGNPEAFIEFKNCGQTPAYDVRGWIHTWFAEHPLKEVLPLAPPDLGKGAETLAPGRTSVYVTPPKPPLPPPQLAILGTPKFTMYIYGEVTYRDIFGKERRTRYRVMHGGAEGVRQAMGTDSKPYWLLKPDTDGNETT